MPSVHFHRGAKRAREARAALGLGLDGPLEDILDTIETRGGAHVLVLGLPDDVAGAYVKRPGIPLLVVCGTHFIARQRFTLAHEFGHFRMGHEAGVDKLESINGRDYSPREVTANAFAAEFLAPKDAISAWGAGCVSSGRRRGPCRTRCASSNAARTWCWPGTTRRSAAASGRPPSRRCASLVHARLASDWSAVPYVVETFTFDPGGGHALLTYSGQLGTDLWQLGERWGDLVAAKWVSVVASALDATKTESERRHRVRRDATPRDT